MDLVIDNIQFKIVIDKPKEGQWYGGSNNFWLTAKHIPTKQSVTIYHKNRHKAREEAILCLDYLVNCFNEKPLFPENME